MNRCKCGRYLEPGESMCPACESDEPGRFGVICHELAHIFLGHLGSDKDLWWPGRANLSRRSVEIEAESVVFIITNRMGLQGSSPSYVSRYLMDEDHLPESVSIDYVSKTAGKLERMARGLMSAPKEKPVKKVNANTESEHWGLSFRIFLIDSISFRFLMGSTLICEPFSG